MNKKNYSIRLISALLSLCLVFSMLTSLAPASSFDFSEKETVSADSSGFDFVLEEDTTLRDAFTKHYIDPNGKRYAVIFPEQIHFKDGESWVEIDNTLQYDASEDAFVSQNDLFVSSFAKTANENCLITIRDGNYQLSWSIDFDSDIIDQGDQPDFAATNSTIKSVNAQITSAEQNDSSTVKSRETISNIGKAVSGVTYKGICDYVDLRYTVLHGKLEEDIILNSPDAISSYTLKINTDGLIAVKRTDNSISFEDEDGNTVFSLAAPWMKDSDVSVTDAINVEISQEGNSVSVKYTPDSEWLTDESRVFPVLIDPSFTTRYYTSNYYDTYVYEGDSASSTRPTETTMKVGKISNKNYYSYIKILNFPDLVGGFSVDEASFDFWVNTTSSLALNLYKVNASWNQNSITYANQPASTLIKNSVTGTANGSNSKYSMDITSWFEDLQDEWTNVSDFFKSSSWNGFKITYTNSVNGNYTQIYSSEYNTVEFRPVLTIQYTYWPNGGIEDGAVYSFVNKSSGKYLTVDGGNTSNGTNVYQYSKNNSLSQAFRLYYEEDDNCFRIRAMCSSNGYGSVLEVPSFSGTIDNTTGYTNSNVRLYSYGSSYPNDQEWIIYPYEYSDYYIVVLRADPNLALTSFGSGNGTSGGTSSTSTGNVFVSQFTGADNQLWKLESGGIQVINGDNIKEEDGGSCNISENQSWLSFCCPATEFGDSVSWYSSNTTSATVDSLGHVVTGTAGIAYIEATVTHSDESEEYYSYTLYVIIQDGTYYFNDKTSNQRRLEYESPSNGLLENAILESYGTNATSEPTQRHQFFKVKYLGSGLYSVRSMLDCAMGWTRSGSSMEMTTIGTSNSTVPSTAKWRIKSDTNGYFIHAYYGTGKTVTAGSSSGDDITLGSYSSSNLREHWTIRKITAQYHGVTLKAKTDELEVGDSFAFTAVVYSTFTDVYGQNGVTWSRTNGTGSATINSSTGLLTGTYKGTVTVTAKYIVNSYTQWTAQQEVLIYKKAIILLPGIMGSTIYANPFSITYNNTIYSFGLDDYLWIPDFSSLNLNRIRASVLALSCDSFGDILYPSQANSPIVNNNKYPYRKYGAYDIYENIYLRLCDEFSNSYDVILYEYDWRFDPYDTAIELNNYLENNYYSNIVFISHSMGGIVSSYYLALGAEARNRVDKHISVGAPFLGAEKLAYVYDTGDALDLFASIDEWLIGNQIKSIMPNITAIYSLLPMETYFTPYLQIKNSAGVITTQISFSSTINVLSTQLNGWNSTLYNSTKNHQSLLFVNGSHITQLVDSYYIVGNGESTPEMLQITLDASNQKNGDVAISSYSTNGDGTVSLHSALINGTINSHLLVKYGSSTVDADHVKLITGEDDEKTFDYICDVINGVDVYAYSDSTFFNKYSGYKEIQ